MTKASVRKIEKKRMSAPVTEEAVDAGLRKVLELVEEDNAQLRRTIDDLYDRLTFQDARGWVMFQLMERMVKGEVKDLNALREQARELAGEYTRLQEESARAQANPKTAPKEQDAVAQGGFEVEVHGG